MNVTIDAYIDSRMSDSLLKHYFITRLYSFALKYKQIFKFFVIDRSICAREHFDYRWEAECE